MPAIEGWFTLDETDPSLIGSRCTTCGTYVFPPASLACPNPDCGSTLSDDHLRDGRALAPWADLVLHRRQVPAS